VDKIGLGLYRSFAYGAALGAFEGARSFQCCPKSLGRFGKIGLQQRRLGYPNILTRGEVIDLGEKMGTQKALGSSTLDGIADFFSCDKSNTPSSNVFAIKEDKRGSVPRRSGSLVDRIKIARSAQAAEVF